MPGAGFYDVNDTWIESTPTFTQQTATLKILGGDADVDEFLRQTRSNIQNLKAIVTDLKSKAVARTFEDYAIYGDVATTPKGFNGMHKLVSTSMCVHGGTTTTPAVGSMKKLKSLVRLVKPNGPDYLIMSRVTRDNISDYAERAESPVTINGRDEMGKPIMYFAGIPIIATDWLLQTESIATVGADTSIYSAKTGGTATSIFAAKLGEKMLAGCQNGGIQVKDLGDLETKDATRTRIKWYVSLALFNVLSLARYDGITDGVWAV